MERGDQGQTDVPRKGDFCGKKWELEGESESEPLEMKLLQIISRNDLLSISDPEIQLSSFKGDWLVVLEDSSIGPLAPF